MVDDKEMKGKPGLGLIIAMKSKKDEDEKEDGEDKYTEMGEEILQLIKDEDAEGLAKALKNFCSVCQGE